MSIITGNRSLLSSPFSFLQGGRPLTDVSYCCCNFFLFFANVDVPHPSSSPFVFPQGREGEREGKGGGATLYNGLYVEASPERGTFFRLQYMKGKGFQLLKYVKRLEICHCVL